MAEFFIEIFNSIDSSLGESGVFLVALSLLTIAFLVALLSSIFVYDYVFLKRVWYFFVLFGISGTELFLHILCANENAYALLTFSVGLIYAVPLLTIRVKKFCTKQQIDFAKFIDKKAEEKSTELEDCEKGFKAENESFNFDLPKPSAIKILNNNENKQTSDIDFSHVKNVIARLEYLSLGANDKRQIKELEANVFAVENGDDTLDTKSKINDGLGALLKIMSKYGV